VLTIAAAATVFTIMLTLGFGIVPREFRWIWQHPGLIAKALFAVLIAPPAIAIVITRAFDLPRAADIGIMLMAISPGAPVALRRSLRAGGHRSLAPVLQILVAMIAVVSMPLSVIALDEVYAGQADIAPGQLAQQVFMAQLLPLGLGIAIRQWLPVHTVWLESRLARLATILLLALVVLVVIDVWQVVVDAGPRIALAVIAATALGLLAGHLMGGPDEATRTAVAIAAAARNAGLALLVATLNHAPPEISATVLVYFVFSALTIVPYVTWRRRMRRFGGGDPP
jgi:BASS family bile acid:Na+ symporter